MSKCKLLLITAILVFNGCTYTTKIVKPNGDVWSVEHRADALIEYKDEVEEVRVDNRGRESVLEGLLKLIGAKYVSDTDLNESN
jgi:hypothetical protein